MDEDYFLSARNPLATADQKHLDAIAAQLWAREDVQRAKDLAQVQFALVTQHTVSQEVLDMLPSNAENFAMRSIQIATNCDAEHPRVYRVYTPPAKFLGNTLPGARWGSENPDTIYRIIPVEQSGRYVVHGKVCADPPSDVSYVLVADTNTSITEGLLGQRALDVAPDGSFAITLDETPANGRANHLQLTAEAKYLFVRDTVNDWNQTPNALRVERLNPPSRDPLSLDELAKRTRLVMQLGVPSAYYWTRLQLNRPGNTMSEPQGTGPMGGLLSQQSSHGWYELADDEAAVINLTALDAAYQSIILYDRWGRTMEYRDHLTSLNGSQSAPDKDGSFSFVVAATDPGVHNWLNTMGLHEFCIGIRWQGISPEATGSPIVTTSVVQLDALESALPNGIAKVSAEQRAAQLAARRASHDRRYIED